MGIADCGLRIRPTGATPMTRTAVEFKARTKEFALRVIRLVDSLPRTLSGDMLGKQLLRSATSVGTNYRAACRGRSAAEFRSKLGIIEQEADESIYWIELLVGARLVKENRVKGLVQKANEILAMIVASIRTSCRKS